MPTNERRDAEEIIKFFEQDPHFMRYRDVSFKFLENLIKQAREEARREAYLKAAELIIEDAKISGDKEVIRMARIWAKEIRAVASSGQV